eukprot:Gb_33603 [translate_table: standard]
MHRSLCSVSHRLFNNTCSPFQHNLFCYYSFLSLRRSTIPCPVEGIAFFSTWPSPLEEYAWTNSNSAAVTKQKYKHRREAFTEGTGNWEDSKKEKKDIKRKDTIDRGFTDKKHFGGTSSKENAKWAMAKAEEEGLQSPDFAEENITRDAKAICSILNEGIEEYSALKEKLAPFVPRLCPQLVCRVVENSKSNPTLPVIRFFSWTELQPGYRHNSATFDEMINFVAKVKHFKTMTRLMKESKSWGFSFTPRTFSFVIEGETLNSVLLDAVLQSINQMNRWKKRGENDAYDALLSTLCNANQLETALQVLKGMVPAGFCPRVHTYNIVTAALCREGRLEDAKHLIEEMKNKGCSPTVITYNRLLSAYIQKDRLNEASALVDSMLDAGCCADSFTYTQLINVACRSKLPDEGLKLLRKMLDAGLKPMQAACNAIVECFRDMDQFDRAQEVLVEMKERRYEECGAGAIPT